MCVAAPSDVRLQFQFTRGVSDLQSVTHWTINWVDFSHSTNSCVTS